MMYWLRKATLILSMLLLQLICMGKNYSFKRLTVEDGLSNNLVNTIYKDSLGFMWFGTLDGLDRYDGLEIRSYSSRFPGAVENVYAITEDYDRSLWVGTGIGLFRYDNYADQFA